MPKSVSAQEIEVSFNVVIYKLFERLRWKILSQQRQMQHPEHTQVSAEETLYLA